MAVSTPAEVQEEYLNLMGPKLGSVFHALYNECVWLHVRWLQYRALFGKDPERIELMNAAAGLFFRVIQDGLFEETLLQLCRMTDPPVTFGHRNLTIQALPSFIKDPSLPPDAQSRIDDLLPDAQSLIEDALAKTEFARDWRNRKLAHTDLALAIEEGAKQGSSAKLAWKRDGIRTTTFGHRSRSNETGKPLGCIKIH